MSRLRAIIESPRIFGALALTLVLIVQLPFANDDFDIGHEAMIGGRFQGPIQRAYLAGGFFKLRGRPILTPLPTIPPSGKTYASHPPLAHWLFHIPVKIFGLSEFTLRLVPILISALTAFLLATLLAQRMGPIAGFACALLYASTPMAFFFGRMANYEAIVMFLGLLAFLLIRGGTKKYFIGAAICLGLATFTDWAAGFFLPGIAIVCWHSRFGWRPLLATTTAMGIAILLYLSILVGWEGGISEAWSTLLEARGLAQDTGGFGFGTLIRAQADHVLKYFGIGGTAITALAVLIALIRIPQRKGDLIDELVFMSFLACVINVALFPGRAINHDFWWFYLLLASNVACTRCVAALFRMRKIIGIVILIGFVAEGTDLIRKRYHAERSGGSRQNAEEVNKRFGPNSLMLMAKKPGSWQFVCDPWIYDSVDSTERAMEIVNQFKNGELSVDEIGIWYNIAYDYADPAMLKKWKAMGADHEQYGETSILKFKRD